MQVALLVCRLLLAGVFVLAGVAKLADLVGSRGAVIGFGVPEWFAAAAGVLLAVVEVAVAAALMPVVSARFGAIAGVLLPVCFVAVSARAVACGRAPDCHCFGQLHSASVRWWTLGRNAALLGVAGFVAVAGWRHAGERDTIRNQGIASSVLHDPAGEAMRAFGASGTRWA